MKAKLVILGVGTLVLLFCSAYALFVVPSWWHHRQLIRQSQPIELALENYHVQHGTYPESLSAAKIAEPDQIYYRREPDGSYILWFGTTLGESMTYRSTTHKWEP